MPRLRLRPSSDRFDPEHFVDDLYRRLLGRPADPAGLATFVGKLHEGVPPAEIAVMLATSDEYKQRIVSATSPRRREPQRYRLTIDTTGTSPFWAFDVTD